jgi:hypothetical protein
MATALILASMQTFSGVAVAQEAPPSPAPHLRSVRVEVPPLPEWPDFSKRPSYSGVDAIQVSVRSDSASEAVTLLEQTKDGWRSVCNSPCVAAVNPGNTFGVAGYGLHPSLPFKLDSSSTVVASPQSGPGFGLTFAGLFCMGHGGVFLGTGLALGKEGPGPIFAVLGGVEVAVGIPLAILAAWKASVRTTVDVKKGIVATGRGLEWQF